MLTSKRLCINCFSLYFISRCVSYCDLSYLDNAWQNHHPSETLHPSAFKPVMRVKGVPSDGTRGSEEEDGGGVGGGGLGSNNIPGAGGGSTFPFGSSRPFCNSVVEGRRRDTRDGQILEIMNRVLETMEKSERRMEDMDEKDVIKLEWQQAALIVDRWVYEFLYCTQLRVELNTNKTQRQCQSEHLGMRWETIRILNFKDFLQFQYISDICFSVCM